MKHAQSISLLSNTVTLTVCLGEMCYVAMYVFGFESGEELMKREARGEALMGTGSFWASVRASSTSSEFREYSKSLKLVGLECC